MPFCNIETPQTCSVLIRGFCAPHQCLSLWQTILTAQHIWYVCMCL